MAKHAPTVSTTIACVTAPALSEVKIRPILKDSMSTHTSDAQSASTLARFPISSFSVTNFKVFEAIPAPVLALLGLRRKSPNVLRGLNVDGRFRAHHVGHHQRTNWFFAENSLQKWIHSQKNFGLSIPTLKIADCTPKEASVDKEVPVSFVLGTKRDVSWAGGTSEPASNSP